MTRLGHVLDALERQGKPEPVVEPDHTPILAALEAIAERLKAPEPIDLKQPVQALIRGLKPLLKQNEIDLTPLVKAVEGIKFPDMPEYPSAEAGPYTFDIQRNGDGSMSRVVATPGAPEKPKAPEVDVE